MSKLILPNNNPTDFNSYNDFMKEQKAQDAILQKRKKELRLQKNLTEWTDSLGPIWSQADLAFFMPEFIKKVGAQVTSSRWGGIILMGASSKGKTFFSYALIKRYIALGWVTPSQIHFIDYFTGMENINGMFQSRIWKDKIFNKNNKIIVVENVSDDFSLIDHRDNRKFWGELTNFCKANQVKLIINYALNKDEETKSVILPNLTGNRTLNIELVKELDIFRLEDKDRNRNKLLK